MGIEGVVKLNVYCGVYGFCDFFLVFVDGSFIYVYWLFGGVVVSKCSDCRFVCWCVWYKFILRYGLCF